MQAAVAGWLIVSNSLGVSSRVCVCDGRSFDPDHDGHTQLLADGPPLLIEDVLLQEPKNNSTAALSPHAPILPIDPYNPLCDSRFTNFFGLNGLPRSGWTMVRSHRRGTPSDRAPHVEHPFTVRETLTGQMSTKVGAVRTVGVRAVEGLGSACQ